MGISRIDFGGQTLIDLTNDSVTPETLAEGETATNAAGEKIVGIMPRTKAFDYTEYGLPVLHLTGDTSAMTKENAVTLDYVYGDRSGTASVKWQGASSIGYPKKNYTIKFDNAFEAVEGWGEQKKYCLKANYIDHSHSRNVCSAKLWGQMVQTRLYTNNKFDVKLITGLIGKDTGVNYSTRMSISDDGVITSTASVYSCGGTVFTGNAFSAGKYTISFEFFNLNSQTEDSSNQIYVMFSNADGSGQNAASTIKTSVNKWGEWVSYSFNVETTTEGWMLGLSAVNLITKGYQYRNISVVAYDSSPSDENLVRLYSLHNGGAIDGFPCIIILNDEFHGLYTFNIPKDGWMFGMGDGTKEAIVCANTHSVPTRFRGLATLTSSDFELEYATDEDNADWVLTSLNTLISAVMNSNGTDLDTTVAKYLDWQSAIDYFIFVTLIKGGDMTDKNYLLATYDGVKWFFSAYDIDSTYGLEWTGKGITRATGGVLPSVYATSHKVMELIKNYKLDELKARYAEIRETIMSEDNLAIVFSNFTAGIPTPIFLEDMKKWTTIPSSAASNLPQILNWYRLRCPVVDKEIEGF